MNCPIKNEVESSVLLEYAADRLPASERAALERHLQVCGSCSAIVNAQRATFSGLDAWDALPVSADFDRKLYARIAQEDSGSWRRFLPRFAVRGWRTAFAPAAAVCAALVAAVLLQNPTIAPIQPARDAVTHMELSEVEQVERTLEDLEMLRQLSISPGAKNL